MIKNKKHFLWIVPAIVVIGYYFDLFPLVIDRQQRDIVPSCTGSVNSGNIYNPLGCLDFSAGNNRMYLVFSASDRMELPLRMKHKKVFLCKNNAILKELQSNFQLMGKGDMATCESKIFVYQNDQLVLCSSFVFTEKQIGLQNSIQGWGEAEKVDKLKELFLKFEPVDRPVVVL